MKIELSPVALGAGVAGVAGIAAVVVAVTGHGGPELAWIGLVVLIVGSVAWVHDRLNRLGDRLGDRELTAFQMGQAGRGGQADVSVIPRPGAPDRT